MAEGARLESVYALIAYRGFESLSHRQYPTMMFLSSSYPNSFGTIFTLWLFVASYSNVYIYE